MPKTRGKELLPVSVLMPAQLYDWIKKEAQAGDRSMSRQVVRLLRPIYERELVGAEK